MKPADILEINSKERSTHDEFLWTFDRDLYITHKDLEDGEERAVCCFLLPKEDVEHLRKWLNRHAALPSAGVSTLPAKLRIADCTDAAAARAMMLEAADYIESSVPSATEDTLAILREAREYVASAHMHTNVIIGSQIHQEPCSRCSLRERIDQALALSHVAATFEDGPLDYERLVDGKPCYRCGKVITARLSHLCEKAKRPSIAHTDHPLRHFDRTCPACIKEGEERFEHWSPSSKEQEYLMILRERGATIDGLRRELQVAQDEVSRRSATRDIGTALEFAIMYAMDKRPENFSDFCDDLRAYFNSPDGGAKP